MASGKSGSSRRTINERIFMKTASKNFASHSCLVVACLMAVLVWCSGCTLFPHHYADPLKGWKQMYTGKPDKVISDDYHDYIDKLPPKMKKGVTSVQYFEDGTGQHAVLIYVSIDGIWEGTRWGHVLIYDKENKRVKMIKYVDGHYSL
jgi:hypothetical protein